MAVTIQVYDHFLERLGDGGFDMDGDTFKLMLLDDSHTFDETDTETSDIDTNEISAGNGYTAGGATLTSISWSQTSGTASFDAANVSWTASGGSIGPASHAVLYSSTADLLICSIDLDGAQTAADGADFNINWNASGIFSIAPA